jgi:hypothetical protein
MAVQIRQLPVDRGLAGTPGGLGMKRLINMVVAIGALGLSTSAVAQDLNQSGLSWGAPTARTERQAAVLGDWSAALAVTEKAYRDNPTLGNEFNLATAYAHTGRADLAIPLYEDVAAKGQFSNATVLYEYRRSDGRLSHRTFNYSDEALRRIALLTGQDFPEDQQADAQ